jgi:CRISPR-associated protein Csb1
MPKQFDTWLAHDGPVALTITELLEPVSGKEGIFFPPTFAPSQEKVGGKSEYVIDPNGTCLVDSIGSQANRLEPMYKRPDLAGLIPEFTIRISEQRTINLLDAGHRAADAAVRFSDQGKKLRDAFLSYRDNGDARPLAKIAPTSLVFGAWDSRDTGAKIPRVVESSIRAYGVERVSRSAQYFSALEKDDLEEMELNELGQKTLSAHGLSDIPSGGTLGGVIAKGGIKREALLNLIVLRSIGTDGAEATRKLQLYILGLALLAFAAPAQHYLRQGCLLVASNAAPVKTEVVWRTGKREELAFAEDLVFSFAKAAAKDFGVGRSIQAVFDPKLVKVAADERSKKKAKSAKA